MPADTPSQAAKAASAADLGDDYEFSPAEAATFVAFKTTALAKYSKSKEAHPEAASDITLKRFLAARDFDHDAALAQYSGYRDWLQEAKVNDIRANPPSVISTPRKLLPTVYSGEDREGHPLRIDRLGAIHMLSAKKLSSPAAFEVFQIWKKEQIQQRCAEQSQKHGKPIFRTTEIVDMAGLGMQHRHGMDLFAAVSRVDERYYPETAHKVFLVNAPWVFPAVYKLAKVFIDEKTKTKIEVLGGSPGQYKARLLEFIAADQLPIEYGGTAKYTVPLPEHEALLGEVEEMELEEMYVGAGKTQTIEIKAINGGTIGWYVRTKDHNVDFSVAFVPEKGANPRKGQNKKGRFRKKKNKKQKEAEPTMAEADTKKEAQADATGDDGASVAVQEKTRCSHHEGSFPVEVAGTAYFIFSNAYSYMRSKTVLHSISFTATD